MTGTEHGALRAFTPMELPHNDNIGQPDATWSLEREVATLIALMRGPDREVANAAHQVFRWRLAQCSAGPEWVMEAFRSGIGRGPRSRRGMGKKPTGRVTAAQGEPSEASRG